jgi:hypothetical protein
VPRAGAPYRERFSSLTRNGHSLKVPVLTLVRGPKQKLFAVRFEICQIGRRRRVDWDARGLRPLATTSSLSQLLEQRFRLLEVPRVKTFGEPAIDRREEIASFSTIASIARETSNIDASSQFV